MNPSLRKAAFQDCHQIDHRRQCDNLSRCDGEALQLGLDQRSQGLLRAVAVRAGIECPGPSPPKPRQVITPPPVIDLMAALKRSLAEEVPKTGAMTAKQKRPRRAADRRQRALLLPVAGGRRKREEPALDPVAVATRSRKKGVNAAKRITLALSARRLMGR